MAKKDPNAEKIALRKKAWAHLDELLDDGARQETIKTLLPGFNMTPFHEPYSDDYLDAVPPEKINVALNFVTGNACYYAAARLAKKAGLTRTAEENYQKAFDFYNKKLENDDGVYHVSHVITLAKEANMPKEVLNKLVDLGIRRYVKMSLIDGAKELADEHGVALSSMDFKEDLVRLIMANEKEKAAQLAGLIGYPNTKG
jgi:hypothetical protein